MPRSDWLHNLAVGGCVIGCALALVSASNAQDHSDRATISADTKKKQQIAETPPAPNQAGEKTGAYKPNCASPKNHDEADFCEQRRMADAAEQGVIWAARIFWFNVFQFGALIVTVIFTAVAAFSARNAARAANRTVAVMEDTAERQLRAYVHINTATIDTLAAGVPITAKIKMKNFGQTPAIDAVHRGRMIIRNFPSDEAFPTISRGGQPSKINLAPGTDADQLHPGLTLSNDQVIQVRAGALAIYIFGEILYKDIYGKERSTKYRLIHGGTFGAPDGKLHGCEEGNEVS